MLKLVYEKRSEVIHKNVMQSKFKQDKIKSDKASIALIKRKSLNEDRRIQMQTEYQTKMSDISQKSLLKQISIEQLKKAQQTQFQTKRQSSKEKLAKAVLNRNRMHLEKKVEIMAKMFRKEEENK